MDRRKVLTTLPAAPFVPYMTLGEQGSAAVSLGQDRVGLKGMARADARSTNPDLLAAACEGYGHSTLIALNRSNEPAT